MSAPTETFDVANSARMAAARAIEAAIAPLNELPGKSAPAPDNRHVAHGASIKPTDRPGYRRQRDA
jgi:hypothetical protein